MKRAASAGFTLIEIMVALVILSLALVVLVEGHYSAVTTLGTARDLVVMRNLVEQATGFAEVGVYAGQLSDSKEYNKRFKGYKWSYDAQAVNDESNPLYSVQVRIEIPEKDPIEFTFFMFKGEEYTPEDTGAAGATGTTGNSTTSGSTSGGTSGSTSGSSTSGSTSSTTRSNKK